MIVVVVGEKAIFFHVGWHVIFEMIVGQNLQMIAVQVLLFVRFQYGSFFVFQLKHFDGAF